MSDLREENRLLRIAGADSLEQLRSVREREQERLEAQLEHSPEIETIGALNGLHDALIVKTLELAEKDLARQGHGASPVPYAYMLFGSGGRSEQTMASDQDSGLVFADSEGDEEGGARNSAYFTLLADLAVRHLTALGYPPCEGRVVASNPDWCMTVSAWERKLDAWFAEPNWENVRYLLIVADGRPVAGDRKLAQRLQNRFYGDMLGHPVIARRMMENTLRHKMIVGVFGQWLPERYGENAGSIDIKYGAYIPMVNVFRLLAVQAGIRETGTLARISMLRDAGLLTEQEAAEAASAFSVFLRLRLLAASRSEDGLWAGAGKIPVKQLAREWAAPLKKSLRLGRKLQRQLEKEIERRFGGGGAT